ncbi:MAG: hypothetical protein ACD_45C00646G0001 [uncultured bacterium]|nr:MAG: hypothetical protein ACD_45C00646G0001 [uncultured bacterium]
MAISRLWERRRPGHHSPQLNMRRVEEQQNAEGFPSSPTAELPKTPVVENVQEEKKSDDQSPSYHS